MHNLDGTEKNSKMGNTIALSLSSCQMRYMQKGVLTLLVILLASPMSSANAALPPAVHLSLRTLTFQTGLLNQHFLHPSSQFGFMMQMEGGRLPFIIEEK